MARVFRCVSLPRALPLRKMAQLHAKDRGLYFVQPAVPARLAADIFLRLPMVPQSAQTRRAFCRVGYDHARIAARASILGRINAKASDVPVRTASLALRTW